jgi:hypothetical protein
MLPNMTVSIRSSPLAADAEIQTAGVPISKRHVRSGAARRMLRACSGMGGDHCREAKDDPEVD